mmetsp:Transcript_88273/g.248548  ORF Transcript_88273/g.248548 Transcript_88273/m.248548 type:complete len:752 (-) Transcript_88273:241-2496(-)
MLKFVLGCLVLLVVLYGAKVALLQVAVPPDSGLFDEAQEEGLGEPIGSEGSAAGDWRPESGNVTLLLAGQRALRRGRDAQALAHIESCIWMAAEGGMQQKAVGAACRTLLAEMHLVGAGMPRNLTKATALLQEAADAGDPDAQFNLAVVYSSMESVAGTKADEAHAVLNLYAASTAGHAGALMAMGYRHSQGYSVPKSCSAAALNYIDVAKRVAKVYSAGMPQAVELIRLNLHQKDRKSLSSSEMNVFAQIATSGDTTVAAAIGKRYLLGIEGFRQDYRKARHYLRMAANRNHAGALALLGYMYCLGLGSPENLDTAYSYFVSAAAQNDALGHNGLGFIYFRGTGAQSKNMRLAFKHFNESAFGGSSDGMFNLASMFLTGTGTDQSFQKAILFYTQALDRGHTPAAYSLAVMHLNGIGVMRDCDIAVNLLKKVCERGEWVSTKLVDAYEFGERQPDRAALLFLKLAEAGHEVAQMNAAHLFDMGSTSILRNEEGGWYSEYEINDGGLGREPRQQSRTVAQRYYELSADQGSASSELRLGDYLYYGWGVAAEFRENGEGMEDDSGAAPTEDEDGNWAQVGQRLGDHPDLQIKPQTVDYAASMVRYQRAAEMTVTGEWMQAFVARGFFNLGFMHQFGLGVVQDLNLAKQRYHRCREVDPSGLHTPVTLMLVLLGAHMLFSRLPPWNIVLERILADVRVHVLVLHFLAIVALVFARFSLVTRLSQQRPRAPSATATPRARAAGQAAPAESLVLH